MNDRLSVLSGRGNTTGIGSLPHHNVDAALGYCFQFTIPFLPQLPVRNVREYMIGQALAGLPGLTIGPSGEAFLHTGQWKKGSKNLMDRLDVFFVNPSTEFEPLNEEYSAWQPFLWEIGERKTKVAKVQIAGPMTCQWALKLSDETQADDNLELGIQIFRLLLARSLGMVKKIKELGTTPLFFVDEPSFYGFSKKIPKHLSGITELKLFLQMLKKEGALVGVHCCSNTDWEMVLDLGMDVLSLDVRLSLKNLLSETEAMQKFLESGGTLCLGVIPTAKNQKFDRASTRQEVVGNLEEALGKKKTEEVLQQAIYSPACGLALHKVEEAEECLAQLNQFVSALV